MNVGDRIGSVALRTASGAAVDIEDYLVTTRVVTSPRYYG